MRAPQPPITRRLHGHSVAEVPPGPLPELDNPPCPPGLELNTVDIFSVISDGEDSDVGGPREMALDYEVAFCNSVTGASSVGTPVIVWVPGWTGLTTTDDYVARWTAAIPGLYDIVAIEPASGAGHDEITEIDAIKVDQQQVPGLSEWGLTLAALLLVTMAAVGLRRTARG